MLQNLGDREAQAREAVRRLKKNAAEFFAKEGSRRFYRAHMERESIEKLVELAREADKDAIEILQNRGRVARSTRTRVPDCFAEFVWEWFLDGPPKAKSGSNPKDTGLNYVTIALCVKIVSQDYGFPEYRNIEHRGRKPVPCRLACWWPKNWNSASAGLKKSGLTGRRWSSANSPH